MAREWNDVPGEHVRFGDIVDARFLDGLTWSVLIFFAPRPGGDERGIIEKINRQYFIRVSKSSAGSNIQVLTGGSGPVSFTGTATLVTDRWYLVACTNNGVLAESHIYLIDMTDGTLVEDTDFTRRADISDVTQEMQYGGLGTTFDEYAGSMYCGAYFKDREFTLEDVRGYAQSPIRMFVKYHSDNVFFHTLQGEDSPERDWSINGHDGIVTGTNYGTFRNPPVAPLIGFDLNWQGQFEEVAGVTFFQTVIGISPGIGLLDTTLTSGKSLPVVNSTTSVVDKAVNYFRSLLSTTPVVAAFSTISTFFRSLISSSLVTSVLTTIKTGIQDIVALSIVTTILSSGSVFVKSIISSTLVTSTISTLMTAFKTITSSTLVSSALSTVMTGLRALITSTLAASVLTTIRTGFQALIALTTATAILTAATLALKALVASTATIRGLSTQFTSLTVLGVSTVSTAVLSTLSSFFQSMVGGTVVSAAISTIRTAFRQLSVVSSSIQNLVTSATRFATLIVTTVGSVVIQKIQLLLQTIQVSSISTSTLATVTSFFQSLISTLPTNVVLTRITTFKRALVVLSAITTIVITMFISGVGELVTKSISAVTSVSASMTKLWHHLVEDKRVLLDSSGDFVLKIGKLFWKENKG